MEPILVGKRGRKLVAKQCKHCGVTFGAQPFDVARGLGLYCSRSCQGKSVGGPVLSTRAQNGSDNPNWRGGASGKKLVYKKRYRAKHPDAAKAHDAVRRAKKAGRLVVLPCETCGVGEGVQAHHDDYTQKLNVRWMCGRCHRRHHGASC